MKNEIKLSLFILIALTISLISPQIVDIASAYDTQTAGQTFMLFGDGVNLGDIEEKDAEDKDDAETGEFTGMNQDLWTRVVDLISF